MLSVKAPRATKILRWSTLIIMEIGRPFRSLQEMEEMVIVALTILPCLRTRSTTLSGSVFGKLRVLEAASISGM